MTELETMFECKDEQGIFIPAVNEVLGNIDIEKDIEKQCTNKMIVDGQFEDEEECQQYYEDFVEEHPEFEGAEGGILPLNGLVWLYLKMKFNRQGWYYIS